MVMKMWFFNITTSYNNEGGFAEILGDNINCGYRYNISVNDGYREDPNGIPWKKEKYFGFQIIGSNTAQGVLIRVLLFIIILFL